MKIFNLLLATLLVGFVIVGCSKDDVENKVPDIIIDEPVDLTKGYFKADITYGDFVKEEAKKNNASLPAKIDISWDKEQVFDETKKAGCAYGTVEDEDVLQFGAVQINGTDTTFLALSIFEDSISKKKYPVAAGNVLVQILGAFFGSEELDLSQAKGTVLPLLKTPGEFGSQIAAATLFASPDFGDSYFEVTEIDEESKKISGKISIKMSISDDTGTKRDIYTLAGEFRHVPVNNEK